PDGMELQRHLEGNRSPKRVAYNQVRPLRLYGAKHFQVVHGQWLDAVDRLAHPVLARRPERIDRLSCVEVGRQMDQFLGTTTDPRQYKQRSPRTLAELHRERLLPRGSLPD